MAFLTRISDFFKIEDGSAPLAASFGQENDFGKPGPVLGMCIEPPGSAIPQKLVSQIAGLDKPAVIIATPRALERYDTKGQLLSRQTLNSCATCFINTKVIGIGRCYALGFQDGSIRIYSAGTLRCSLQMMLLHDRVLTNEADIIEAQNNSSEFISVTALAVVSNQEGYSHKIFSGLADGNVLCWNVPACSVTKISPRRINVGKARTRSFSPMPSCGDYNPPPLETPASPATSLAVSMRTQVNGTIPTSREEINRKSFVGGITVVKTTFHSESSSPTTSSPNAYATPSQCQVWVGWGDGTLSIFDEESLVCLHQSHHLQGTPINILCSSQETQLVFSLSNGALVHIFDATCAQVLAQFKAEHLSFGSSICSMSLYEQSQETAWTSSSQSFISYLSGAAKNNLARPRPRLLIGCVDGSFAVRALEVANELQPVVQHKSEKTSLVSRIEVGTTQWVKKIRSRFVYFSPPSPLSDVPVTAIHGSLSSNCLLLGLANTLIVTVAAADDILRGTIEHLEGEEKGENGEVNLDDRSIPEANEETEGEKDRDEHEGGEHNEKKEECGHDELHYSIENKVDENIVGEIQALSVSQSYPPATDYLPQESSPLDTNNDDIVMTGRVRTIDMYRLSNSSQQMDDDEGDVEAQSPAADTSPHPKTPERPNDKDTPNGEVFENIPLTP